MIPSIFSFMHTKLISSIDTLIYRKGRIEIRLELSPDRQEAFEKQLDLLKLVRVTAIDTAQDEYQKQLRALFVEFGRIVAEPPLNLIYVEPKIQTLQAAE